MAIHCPGLDAKGCGNSLISEAGWFINQEFFMQCIRNSGWTIGIEKHSEFGEFLDTLCQSCGALLVDRRDNSMQSVNP